MTSPSTKQKQSTIGSPAPKPTTSENTDDISLRIVRQGCKARVYQRRGVLLPSPNNQLLRLPKCPICGEYAKEPSMHEVFLTRGHVQKAPIHVQAKIFVPQNVVLVHEGKCHRFAQHYEEGKRKCALNIFKYHKPEHVLHWINGLPFTRTIEEARYIWELCDLDKYS